MWTRTLLLYANCLCCNCFALFTNSISGWFCFPYAWHSCYCLISPLIATTFFPGIFFLGLIITYHHPNIPNPLWPLWFFSSDSIISQYNLKYKFFNLFLSPSRTWLTKLLDLVRPSHLGELNLQHCLEIFLISQKSIVDSSMSRICCLSICLYIPIISIMFSKHTYGIPQNPY